MDCYDTALRYAKERVQFGKSIAPFQLQQKKLAEMITEITKAQLLAFRLGLLKNEGKATTAQISMAKRNNGENWLIYPNLTSSRFCRSDILVPALS